MAQLTRYRGIFAPASLADRRRAFEDYWACPLERDGALHEEAQALEHKTGYYQRLQARPLQARHSLTSVQTMAALADQIASQRRPQVDRRLLVLTAICKFASHEAGRRAAWLATPSWKHCRNLTDRITRYHLCEEFCHLRLFAEMFKVFALDVEWPLLPWPIRTTYAAFARCPNLLLGPIAFGSELMGMMFYRHIWRVLEEVFATEPEAVERLHESLGEIKVDELGHIGERRSFLGHTGVALARRFLPVMMRRFFADIPEAGVILDVHQMVQDALVFDYSSIDAAITARLDSIILPVLGLADVRCATPHPGADEAAH